MRILLLFFFLIITSAQAQAFIVNKPCPCEPVTEKLAEKAYKAANIIIKARIINPSKGFTQAGSILNVETLRVIKGEDSSIPDEINMNYNNFPAACGQEFEAGDISILPIYDTREISRNSLARGYGFRLMDRCNTQYVRHYLDNQSNRIETE